MALLVVLLQTGLVLGSNYGYVEWSENDRDENPSVFSTQGINREPPHHHHHHPTYSHSPPATERTVVAHKIEEDLPRVVTAFLHSGDSSALRQVNCSRRYELSSLRGGLRVATHYSLHGILDTMTHATNFLNMILQANRSREDTLQRDLHWYQALVRSMLEGDPKIHRAVVSFHGDVFLQATRNQKEVVLQDRLLKSRSAESEWLNEFRDGRRAYTLRKASEHKSGVYLLDKNQIKWSAPYLECEHGAFVPYWLLTLSAGFYGLKRDSALEFRGVVRLDVNLQDVDIDQCSDSGWFAGTHRCNLTSMECVPIAGHGFVLDKYKCRCKRGFYHPSRVALSGLNSKAQGSRRDDVSDVASKCLPCRVGCHYCRDNTPCLAREDSGLRLAVASFQGLCVLLDLASMLAVYHFRRSKSIRTSGFILLETLLFGALLLYFPVMILYFHPSVFRCILLRWVRLLGFAILYGTIILKLYRVLKVFLSRTAQRTPYMTSWRVLRMLAVILLVVLWFLVAWTSAVCQNPELSRALITAGLSSEGLQFSMCLLDRWDYMMAVAELLFLLWGVYLCYAVRTIHSAFHEPRYMAVAIYNELLLSAVFHVIRFSVAPGLHPDWMLMLIFAHTHLTVTVTVGLLLVPKFFTKETQARDDIATEAYEEELDIVRSGSYFNNSITSAWSEHSLDPEDIRDELKKLYAQLEVYKRKKMLANNPHLQKKRNSKKGLGRTLMKRITEIPETMHIHRQCSREDGSEHGSNRSTLRRNHPESNQHGKPREDSLKNKVASLQKSLSYDHVCDQDDESGSQSGSAAGDKMTPVGNGGEGSLLGSLIGRKHCKKHPEPVAPPSKLEPAKSTESVALFWKSASVHNLTHEKKPVHLRTSIMQKSLSVIASAKEKMPGLGNKTQSVEDASKKGAKGPEGRMLSEVDETPEHFPKMIISQSVEYSKTHMKMGIMKQQVSGSQPSICSETGRNLYDVSEVCPWEPEEPQTPSEAKTQKHVSIAPDESDAVRRGSGGSGLGKCGRSQQRPKTGQSPSNRRRSKDRGGGEREESRETRKARGPRSPLPLKLDVSPWDFEEQPMLGGVSEAISPERIRRKKSVTPTDGKPKALRSDHSKSTGSLLQPPSLMVEICPWDYNSPPSPKQEKICSSPSAHKKKRKGSCSSNHKAEKEKGREKNRERRSSSGKPPSERRRVSQSAECGGLVSERRRSSSKDPEGAEVRRARETEASDGSFGQTKTSTDRKKERSHKPAVGSAPKMADVCPWDFEDQDPAERA
ncbi:probable G-protein coupled receptor 158 [Hippocampus zosterae]|uniref:probable G-protein coupled receptor 158 n=1 Tax=Hippocampus zosterae TaxID=109293 RepID=UPI00223E05DC|nr:probable G-protein coupled receptor 158 [Hippocampus zosterae]